MTQQIDINAYMTQLQNLNYKYQIRTSGPSTLPPDYAGLPSQQYVLTSVISNNNSGYNQAADNFIKSLYTDGNYADRANWAAFSTGWQAAVTGGAIGAFNGANPLFVGLITNFKLQMGIPFNPNTNGLGELAPLEGAKPAGEDNVGFVNTLFQQNFEYFLGHYDWNFAADNKVVPGFPTNATFTTLFTQAWANFLTSRAAVSSSPQDLNETPGPTAVESANLTIYQTIFDQFVGPNPPIPFDTLMQNFYADMVKSRGYFNPSHQLGDWIEIVQRQSAVVTARLSSVTGTNSQKALILTDIFALLILVISTLQKLTAAQAERLTFYANYQKAYTDLITKIPIIGSGDVAFFVTDDTRQQESISFAQAQNSSFTERLRSYRDAIASQSQTQQTAVNQSNDIVQQESNLATSILQQMSTIILAMFK